MPETQNWKQFEETLNRHGISIEFKYRGQTDEVQGISFRKGNYSFKGSEVDRKFSYSKLNAIINENNYVYEQQQVIVPTKSQNTDGSLSESVLSGAVGVASAIGGLFDISPSSYDENEAEYLRQEALKKKKKPKKRRGISR